MSESTALPPRQLKEDCCPPMADKIDNETIISSDTSDTAPTNEIKAEEHSSSTSSEEEQDEDVVKDKLFSASSLVDAMEDDESSEKEKNEEEEEEEEKEEENKNDEPTDISESMIASQNVEEKSVEAPAAGDKKEDLEEQDNFKKEQEDNEGKEEIDQIDQVKESEKQLDEEMKAVGAMIVFPEFKIGSMMEQWTNLKWMSYERKVRYCTICTRLVFAKKSWFGVENEQYLGRKLVIYEQPNVILILRAPTDNMEAITLLGLKDSDDPCQFNHPCLIVEAVIDPLMSKLRLSPLLTQSSIASTGGNNASDRRRTCFELLTPTETFVLSTTEPNWNNSFDVTKAKMTEGAISASLWMAHCPVDRHPYDSIAWKHQIVLGTLTSFVISGNLQHVEAAIAASRTSNLIDQKDESGRCALHYACEARSHAAIKLLLDAGANSEIPIPTREGTINPIHLCAANLDASSLSELVGVSSNNNNNNRMRANPNTPDFMGRTAVYVAVADGKLSNGVHDPEALASCLSVLAAVGGNFFCGQENKPRHPISLLASRWMYQSLEIVFKYQRYRFPLPSASPGISLAGLYQYPIHSAIISLNEIVENPAGKAKDKYENNVLKTIESLLNHGFEPNERIEGILRSFEGSDIMMQYVGFSPLQILATLALSSSHQKVQQTEHLNQYTHLMQLISSIAELLVRKGARLSLEAPPRTRLKRNSLDATGNVDRAILRIDGNKELVDLLGGAEFLNIARKKWTDFGTIEAVDRKVVVFENAPVASSAPGGSSEKSCALCWSQFGTLMNRKHRCRTSNRYVCDECSSKRVIVDGVEHRVSDGQYLLFLLDIKREKEKKLMEEKARQQRIEQMKKKNKSKLDDLEQSRNHLFGGLIDKATNLVLGMSVEDNQESMESTLNQAKDALNERGEKLHSLEEKTAKLKNASENFANMARDLERAQRGLW